MTARAACVTDRPELLRGVRFGRAIMKTDILSDVLQAVRLSGAIFFDVQTSTPWVAQAPPSSEIADRVMPGSQHVIEYHVVISGRGWGGLSDDPDFGIIEELDGSAPTEWRKKG